MNLDTTLEGKTIFITGGTGALGNAFVRRAAGSGGKVFFSYRKREGRAGELAQLGAVPFAADLNETESLDRLAAGLTEKTDGLDVLIHNAAEPCDRGLAQLTEPEWDRAIRVNLKAPFYLTQKLLPLLLNRRPAKIFFIISRMACAGGAGAAAYSAAKAGLVGLCRSLAREFGKRQVLVNAVNPGFMMSSMTGKLPPEVLEDNRAQSLLKAYSEPDQVADFLVYLCSDRMRQVTGQIFHFESRPVF